MRDKTIIAGLPFLTNKVVVVIPPLNIDRYKPDRIIVSGSYIVCEVVKESGLPVHLLDFQNDSELTLDKLLQYIDCKTLLGITATVGAFSWIQKLLSYLKKSIPDSKRPCIIAGGSLATSNPKALLDLGIDFVIREEIDTILPKFIDSLNNGDLSKVPGVSYLNEVGIVIEYLQPQLPEPENYKNMDIILLKKLEPIDTLPIQLTRGCPYKCDSCGGVSISVGKIRRINVDQVRSVIEYYKKNILFQTLKINDNDFLQNKEWGLQVAKILYSLEIKWIATLKANDKKEAMYLPFLVSKGLIGVDFDIESIHPKIHVMNNLFNKSLSIFNYRRAVRIAQGLLDNNNITITIKTGWKGEEIKELLELKDFILDLQNPITKREATELASEVSFIDNNQKGLFVKRLTGKIESTHARYWDIRPVGYPGSLKYGRAIIKGSKLGYLPIEPQKAEKKYLELLAWYLINRFSYNDKRWLIMIDMCNEGKVDLNIITNIIKEIDKKVHPNRMDNMLHKTS
jgi:hypothetical protein